MTIFNKEHLIDVRGGDEENRTPDPLLARQVLSQLSYTPKNKDIISHLFCFVKTYLLIFFVGRLKDNMHKKQKEF